MTENRTERTPGFGLLALMQSPSGGGPASSEQGWSFPYWNQLMLDALIAALHDAPRTGAALLAAPPSAPALAVSEVQGLLPAGQTLEVVQTWVDQYGRETDPGPAGEVSTGEAIANPTSAAILGQPSSAATGFDGGLLEVWYTWYDESAGETLPSPLASVGIPYRTGGLKSQVLVTLPATPASAGAAGAFVYVRHRSGPNIVRAAAVSPDTETEITLDGMWVDCFAGLPLANTTRAVKAIDINGVTPAPADAAHTRFYIRQAGEVWSAADRRLKLGGIDQFDPATVVYPLVFTGAISELTAGFPPPVSLVKALRPLDLSEGESIGVLPRTQLPGEVVLEEELAKATGDGVISGLEVAPSSPASMEVIVDVGEAILASGRYLLDTAEPLAIPAADAANPRIDLVCLASDRTLEGPSENEALKGTAAAAPSPPSVPAGYLALAEILVDAGASSIAAGKITDRRYIFSTVRAHHDEATLHFTGTEKSDCLLSPVDKTDLTDGGATELHYHTGASTAETNEGTETTKGVTPSGLAGSYAGTKSMVLIVVEKSADVKVGDDQIQFPIPPALDGMNLVSANAVVNTAGTTNATTIGVRNVTDSQEMLSSNISIASRDRVGTPGTVDEDHDDVATNDILRIDVKAVSATAPKGLMVMLEFRLP